MTILLSDPRVGAMPVHECGAPLVRLDRRLCAVGSAPVWVRADVADRLAAAQCDLPAGLSLAVVEGARTAEAQQAIITEYTRSLHAADPRRSPADLHVLASRFVAPLAVAPHVAGAAVDLTLVGPDGCPLDLGTAIDATPEESDGACYLDSPRIGAEARHNRETLTRVLTATGLVNYPTEWWHWSHGDRYWALTTGAPAALYGPVAWPEAA